MEDALLALPSFTPNPEVYSLRKIRQNNLISTSTRITELQVCLRVNFGWTGGSERRARAHVRRWGMPRRRTERARAVRAPTARLTAAVGLAAAAAALLIREMVAGIVPSLSRLQWLQSIFARGGDDDDSDFCEVE